MLLLLFCSDTQLQFRTNLAWWWFTINHAAVLFNILVVPYIVRHFILVLTDLEFMETYTNPLIDWLMSMILWIVLDRATHVDDHGSKWFYN